MATIYPSEISKRTESKAEKILFSEFKRQLPDDYVVIHSKSWIDATARGYVKKRGECDFIILHPQKGLLFIEAKSGREFFCSGLDEYWISDTTFRNPYNQVVDSQYEIIREIKDKLPNFDLPYGIAIAFPEADSISQILPSNLLRSMIFLKGDIESLKENIDEALRVCRKPLPEPVSRIVFDRIVNILRGKFHITTSLNSIISSLKQQFFSLEDEQVEVLNMFETNPRVIVEGCPGSGKTLIALEKAYRASTSGKSVLILCYNIPLSQEIRKRVENLEINADVYNFHGFCEFIVNSTGGSFSSEDCSKSDFWNKRCADLLDEAAHKHKKKYNCIIVDEAQDFIHHWWPIIEKFVAPPGELYIFIDPSQNIFSRKIILPADCTKISLNKNFRNSPSIVKLINSVFGTDIKSPNNVEDGILPTGIKVRDDLSEFSELNNVIYRLIKTENVEPNQIVILGKHPFENSILSNVSHIGGAPLIDSTALQPNEKAIRYSSIYRFKGLEADCIILIGVGTEPRLDIAENSQALFMTGISRAKFLLFVLHRFTAKPAT